MKLDFVFQNLTADKNYSSKFFEKILIAGIKELKFKSKKIGISVNLVGEGKIKKLNQKYRNKNKVTDVLSFPMQSSGWHCPEGAKQFKGPFDYAQGISSEAFDMGDIFICLSFAKNEAKSENVSIDKKLAQLAVHGFLHLAGFEHKRLSGEKKMSKVESRILKNSGIIND